MKQFFLRLKFMLRVVAFLQAADSVLSLTHKLRLEIVNLMPTPVVAATFDLAKAFK